MMLRNLPKLCRALTEKQFCYLCVELIWKGNPLNVQRKSVETVRTAWENLQTAKARIEAFNIEITSSEIALEGVRQEANVGSRTVLDVLDAEQELLDAQVNLVRAERDGFVAATELSAGIGKLTAKKYQLDVTYYDEQKHYKKVRDKLFGIEK